MKIVEQFKRQKTPKLHRMKQAAQWLLFWTDPPEQRMREPRRPAPLPRSVSGMVPKDTL